MVNETRSLRISVIIFIYQTEQTFVNKHDTSVPLSLTNRIMSPETYSQPG